MIQIPVSSSNLKSVGYQLSAQTLEIEFNSEGIYQYFNVPESVYQGLMTAVSHGSYFHQFIKDTYPYKRVG